MTKPLKLAVLLVSYNRRDLTVRAVKSLRSGPDLTIKTVLFDDASNDGTVDAVLAEKPEAVIVKGNGDAYWNGGLYKAWTKAIDLDVDAYLWLNDDVMLDEDALSRIESHWRELLAQNMERFVLASPTHGSDGQLTYGGMKRKRNCLALRVDLQPITNERERIDTFNGNIVLIPHAVVERVGINDPEYFHKFGDIDYGLTVTAAGIPSYVLPGTYGLCDKNPPLETRHLNFFEKWKLVNSHLGLPMKSWWRLVRRHSGIWFLPHFLAAYYRTFFR